MKTFSLVLLGLTVGMIATHLATPFLLRRAFVGNDSRRRFLALVLLRWEAFYYASFLAYVAVFRSLPLAIAAAVLGTIHLGAWAYGEFRPAALNAVTETGGRNGLLSGVELFDLGEAVVLVWIAIRLAAMIR